MFPKTIMRYRPYWLTLVLTLIGAPTALAGGFAISVEAAPSPVDPQLKDAVLLVRPYGCHQPAHAALSGTAEGLVKGQRKSLSLQFTPISQGVYAVKQQWPAEGIWLLAITGTYRGITSSALVELGPSGKFQAEQTGPASTQRGKELTTRIVPRKIAAEEIESALQALASKTPYQMQASGTAK